MLSQKQKVPVQFPVRACAWVTGQSLVGVCPWPCLGRQPDRTALRIKEDVRRGWVHRMLEQCPLTPSPPSDSHRGLLSASHLQFLSGVMYTPTPSSYAPPNATKDVSFPSKRHSHLSISWGRGGGGWRSPRDLMAITWGLVTVGGHRCLWICLIQKAHHTLFPQPLPCPALALREGCLAHPG